MDAINNGILSSASLPKEIHEKLKVHIAQISVKKGEILQHKGDEDRKGFFVKKGLLRSYTIDKKGKEHIFMFAPEGWIIGDIEAQTQNSPAVLLIDALEHSELEVLNEKIFTEFRLNYPQAFSGSVEKLVRRVGVLQRRVLMLMSATAVERYQEFIKTYPNIVQRVPQRMIASYLGITPEALSKIRGDLARHQ